MKNYVDVIGIDVSKLTIDAHIHNRALHRVFSNTTKGYKALISWVEKYLKVEFYFLCFENTGHYSTNLSVYLSENDIDYVEENPLANLKVLYGTGAIKLNEKNIIHNISNCFKNIFIVKHIIYCKNSWFIKLRIN